MGLFNKKGKDKKKASSEQRGKMSLKVTDKFFFDQLPFVVFLTFIGVLYIANSYYVESTVREMENVKKDIIEAKNEFVIAKTKSSLMGQRIEVLKIVEESGLKEFAIPSYKLVKEGGGE